MLTFSQASYSGVACGTITGAYVTVTTGGVATAGVSVTTTLSNGYKFADETSTNTQVSGSNGRVNLPGISVPAAGGTGSISAISGAATASSSTTSPAKANAIWRQTNGATSSLTFPVGTVAVGDQSFLTPTGNLYVGQSGLVASNVASASSFNVVGTGWYHSFVRNDGSAGWTGPGVNNSLTFPSGTKAVGDQTYLTPTGDLYLGQSALIASNVTSATAQPVSGSGWLITASQKSTC